MGLERYLCVGGVEVANPNRTLSYLRNLGNPCQPNPPSLRDCCLCPDWQPSAPCSITVTAGMDVSDPDEVCAGIFALGDGFERFSASGAVFGYAVAPVVRPPLPAPNVEGWQLSGEGSPLGPDSAISGCFPYGASPIEFEALYQVFVLTDLFTGAMAIVVSYVDFVNTAPGDPGQSAVSFDLGATFQTGVVTHVFEDLPCSTTPGQYQVTSTLSMGEEFACTVLLAVSGLVGPYSIRGRVFPMDAPFTTDDFPGADAPGWEESSDPDTMPFWGPGGSCIPRDIPDPEDLPPDGFYEITWTDATGREFVLYSLNEWSVWTTGSWGNLAVSYDGGQTWHDQNEGDGYYVFDVGEPLPSFATPAEDDAPWYDPAVPESADVLGVWLEEARVSVPWDRTARDALRGASLSRGRLGGRELQLVGWVYTRSEAATHYARQWLFEALAGDGCDGGGCDLPDAEVWTHCDPLMPGAGRRTLKRVGLTAYDPEIEPEFPRTCGLKFEATLTAELPELFLDPLRLVSSAPLTTGEDLVCNLCHPCPELESSCSCGGLNTPPRVVQQPDPASVFCSPVAVDRSVFQFEPPNYWRDGTLIVTVDAGQDAADPTATLANLRIRGWANPAGLGAGEVGLLECQEPCIDLEVGCVPARSQIIIDGTTRRAVVVCEGEEQNGYAYLSSGGGQRLEWPDVSCYGLLVAIDADPYHTPEGAAVSIDFVLRERG